MAIRLIGIEEHFRGRATYEGAREQNAQEVAIQKMYSDVGERLNDLSVNRINAMDRGNVAIQVVSHVAAIHTPEVCIGINNQLYEAVQASKGRLRGFAILPMAPIDVEASVKELERCVKELNFVGAQIPNHADGTFFDGKKYWPLYAKAEELDVPIYFHPTLPTPWDLEHHFNGEYPDEAALLIGGGAWGWHINVGQSMLRLFCAGVFDAYPRLKVVIGHNGEGLPFMLERIQRRINRKWPSRPSRDWKTVWNENFWITTSGMFALEPLKFVLAMCKPERVLYSLDYPFEDPKEGLEFMESVQKSGIVSQERFEMICYKNAEKLLRLA